MEIQKYVGGSFVRGTVDANGVFTAFTAEQIRTKAIIVYATKLTGSKKVAEKLAAGLLPRVTDVTEYERADGVYVIAHAKVHWVLAEHA